MDPLLAADRLPHLAERAMRAAVLAAVTMGRMTPRSLVNDALIRFERVVGREATTGVRPALLFAERDRIVRELRGFIDGRLAARLAALRKRDVLVVARDAAPFDAIVRGRRGGYFAVLFRRLPADGRRLELLRRVRKAAVAYTATPIVGVLVYDFASGRVSVLRCGDDVTSLAA